MTRKFWIITFLVLFLATIGMAAIQNASYFSDPNIANGEVLKYRITNSSNQKRNRTLTMTTQKQSGKYQVVMNYVHDDASRKGFNNVVTGLLKASNMMPLTCKNVVNGQSYYTANYAANHAVISANYSVIPGLESAGNKSGVVPLKDVVLDCELYMFQMRGLIFDKANGVDMQLYTDDVTSYSGNIHVLGTETIKGISCYKIEAEPDLPVGQVTGWIEKAVPHRMIKLQINVMGDNKGDVFELVTN